MTKGKVTLVSLRKREERSCEADAQEDDIRS